ncbi:MAG: DUF1559 domain-containing protein, partial [Victivallaceae bacterium]|nr:DUF1559 domain-containing protein [Victivallaceae bacterium]
AMLLPALNKARDKAKEISCISNLKQIGTAMSLYTDDYEEYAPQANAATYWSALLLDYLKNKNIFYCPMDKSRSAGADWPAAGLGNDISYGYNIAGLGHNITGAIANPFSGTKVPFSAKLSKIKNPSETLTCVDSYRTDDATLRGYYVAVPAVIDGWTPTFRPYIRHGNRSSLVFVDGHAKGMITAELTALDDATQAIDINRYKYWSPIR